MNKDILVNEKTDGFASYKNFAAKETQLQSEQEVFYGTNNISRVDKRQSFPLSFAQQGLWFLQQLQPNHSFYNVFGLRRGMECKNQGMSGLAR